MNANTQIEELQRRRRNSLIRTVIILAACFIATLFILHLELNKRAEESVLDGMPSLVRQSDIGAEGVLEEIADRMGIAAGAISGEDLENVAQPLLDTLNRTEPFVQMGLRLADGRMVLSSGETVDHVSWPETKACPGSKTPFRLGPAQWREIQGRRLVGVTLFVDVPDTDVELFGVIDLLQLQNHPYFRSLDGTDPELLIFETETGMLLLDTYHDDPARIGSDFYELGYLDWGEIRDLKEEKGERIMSFCQKEAVYLCMENASLPGWSLCVTVPEATLGKVAQSRGIPTAVAYTLLIMLYGAAAVAVLLYQNIRERQTQNRLDQEVARNNSLMNAVLPDADIEVFELLPSGMIRLLAPETGHGRQLKASLGTPLQLLSYLNCDPFWEGAFQAALEQAAQGQESEIEFQTMDAEETWLSLRIEPLTGNEEVDAIGTVRDVTGEVQEAHRRKTAEKFISRMMEGTIAGIEISLEADRWQLLWGWDYYEAITADKDKPIQYSVHLNEQVVPSLHPQDKENYLRVMDRKALLSAFLSGTTLLTLEYRIKFPPEEGYEWHTCEVYLYRDAAQKATKCNLYIRQVTKDKQDELEERSRLAEKEHALFLQARKLVESEDELDFVHVIADYYQAIYAVNLRTDQTRSVKVPQFFSDLLVKAKNHLSATMDSYAQNYIAPNYVAPFLEIVNYDNLKEKLLRREKVDYTYKKLDGTWIGMRVFAMPDYTPMDPETLWVFEDDTDTMNLRKEEEKARVMAEAAEAASQAKSQFLANMSHDIRTPLNAILGMSELGLRESSGLKKDSCFRDIRGSGRILLENINSILDLSKIEAGKMEIVPERYHILSALHDVITVLRMRAQEKKLDFVVEVDETIPSVLYGDAVSITHIIMNLGSNAVKYTETGTVTLAVTWEPLEQDGSLVIHMKDTGEGIRDEDLPFIFHSYSQLRCQANRHIEGTGLGLPICKKLTEMMDGVLGVESTCGVGSDFWVRLPQRVLDAAPCGPYRGDSPDPVQSHGPTFTSPESVVLVVDDQPINLKVCQGLLQPYEMEVHTARSGPEAIRKLMQVWPDLVLMDHMMPGMDGVETVRRIREMGKKDPYFAVVPIVALTANAMKGAKEEFLARGFNDFLSKPIELDLLDEILHVWLPEDKQQPARPAEPIQPEPEAVPEDLAELPGIDVLQGIRYCGTAEVYRKTLALFMEQLPGRRQNIQAAFDGERPEEYVLEVHSLKSAARWIGAMDLGALAEALEMAGRGGDRTTLLRDTPALLDACRAMEAGVSPRLSRENGGETPSEPGK